MIRVAVITKPCTEASTAAGHEGRADQKTNPRSIARKSDSAYPTTRKKAVGWTTMAPTTPAVPAGESPHRRQSASTYAQKSQAARCDVASSAVSGDHPVSSTTIRAVIG